MDWVSAENIIISFNSHIIKALLQEKRLSDPFIISIKLWQDSQEEEAAGGNNQSDNGAPDNTLSESPSVTCHGIFISWRRRIPTCSSSEKFQKPKSIKGIETFKQIEWMNPCPSSGQSPSWTFLFSQRQLLVSIVTPCRSLAHSGGLR